MSMHNLPYTRGMVRHADTSYGLPAPITEYINIEKYSDGNDLYLHHVASPELDVGPNPKHKLYSRAMNIHREHANTIISERTREDTRSRKIAERRRAHNDNHYAVESSSRFHHDMMQTAVPTEKAASQFSLALDGIQAKLSTLQKSINEISIAIRETRQSCLSCGRGHEDHVPIADSGEGVGEEKTETKEADRDFAAEAVVGGGVVIEGDGGDMNQNEKVGNEHDSESYEIVGGDEGKKNEQMETCNEGSICWC
ncbi:hypothetical protein N7G274_009294 [Stereocaulon virgatum]|uniref:Uncharacterized protein n=1 Tax=Stereocaulon virgatum TaxID=373712 RepID=A0ABR3ZZV7_9LECA